MSKNRSVFNAANNHSRRDFITAALTLCAGVSVIPKSLADIYKGSETQMPIIVGDGDHKYEWIPDWLTPPETIKWGDTQGVAQDADGKIYISHTVHPDSAIGDAIVVFSSDGKFLTSWGSEFRGGGHGLDIRNEGHTEYLYHCDTAHRKFAKTKLDGTVVWEQGLPVESGVYKEGMNFIPTNIAFGENGDFYVADGYGSSFIHQFKHSGEYVRTFGGAGTEPGQLNTPHGIWLDNRGKEPELVVADRSNHRLQYFDLDGGHKRFVTQGMRQPCHFKIRGQELLVPDLDSVVTILDADNKVITHLGDGFPSNLRDSPRSAFIPGKFIHPHSAMYLHNGDILVVEWVPIGRITLLKKLI